MVRFPLTCTCKLVSVAYIGRGSLQKIKSKSDDGEKSKIITKIGHQTVVLISFVCIMTNIRSEAKGNG